MKMKFLFIAAIISVSFYLSGCEKESSVERGEVIPVVTNLVLDSNYLDKIVFIDLVTGDTAGYNKYNYDNLKRVVSLSEYEAISLNTFQNRDNTYYSYNGNDTVPFKMLSTHVSSNMTTNDSTITYFSFSNNKRVSDSLIMILYGNLQANSTFYRSVSKTIKNYQYVSNNIFCRNESIALFDNGPFPITPTLFISTDTANVDANGNLVFCKHFESSFTTGISTFTYDNKPNPFYKLSNHHAMLILPYGETFIDEMQAKNNRLHAIENNGIAGTGFNEDFTGKYVYRINGYPKQIEDILPVGVFKTIFIYKSL